MAATVFYCDDELPEMGAIWLLDGAAGHHAAVVRRIGVGELITVGNGHGSFADCEVVATSRSGLDLKVVTRRFIDPPRPRITVVQALPKADRSELAIELATEAGADSFIPWTAARCVARWDAAKAVKGVAKWQMTARAAAQQSRRAYIPAVTSPMSTKALVEFVRGVTRDSMTTGAVPAETGLVLMLHESGIESLKSVPLTAEHVVLIVGPEGGLADEEIALLADAGAQAVVLGPQVLRTSTAAAVALGAIGALTSRW